MKRGHRSRLPTGKIPIEVLESTVLRMTGARSSAVQTPPRAGLDFAAVRVGGRFMLVSADPITGVSKDIGNYAVKVSANDVATSGNRPQFAESVILLPERSTRADIRTIARQIHETARRLGIAIVGGHTEVTPHLDHPIVVITAFAFAKSFVTSGDAKDGDTIMMTKTAGIEGTAELVREGLVPGRTDASLMGRARSMINDIGITEEAMSAFGTGRVHAMHDCTEGGVLGAVYEMSLASGLGFRLEEQAVPIAPETREVCSRLSIDPLRLIGSGSLILAVERGKEEDVESALRPVSMVTRIGRFQRGARLLYTKAGESVAVDAAPEDELWRVLGRPRRRGHRR